MLKDSPHLAFGCRDGMYSTSLDRRIAFEVSRVQPTAHAANIDYPQA